MAMAINPVKIFGADGRLKKIIDGQSDKEILSSGIAHYNAQNPQKPVTQKMLKNLDLLKGKLEEPKNSRWTKEMDAKVISWMLHTDTTSGKKIAEEIGVDYQMLRHRAGILKRLLAGMNGTNISRHQSKLDRDNEEMMKDLKNSKATLADLGKKWGVAGSTIGMWRKNLGYSKTNL